MKLIKTAFLLLICCFTYGQSNSEKVNNLKFYLSQIKDNLYFARQYADSSKMLAHLDSIETQTTKAEDFANAIIIVADTIIEPSDAYINPSSDYNENNEDGDYSGKTKKGDLEVPEGNPMIDKINPFKKTKTSFIIETGINNFHIESSNAKDAKVNPGSSWYWNFALIKQIYISKGMDFNFGFAFQRNRFNFSNDVALSNVTENLSVFETVANVKNDPKLIVDYLNIPLMFKFKFSKNFNFFIGGLVGYRIGTRQELNLKLGTVEIEEVRKNPYGLNNWNYAIKGGISLNKFHLIGQYQLSNLFESKTNYTYHTFMIGTMIKI